MPKEIKVDLPANPKDIKEALQGKPFEYILDYFYCSSYSHYETIKDNKEFIENLRKQCTSKGFVAFEKALNTYGKILKKRQDEGRRTPTMPICANDQISIDGGETGSQILEKSKTENPTVKSCILYNDIVELNCFFNHIPYGSEGKVLDVYPPCGTDVIKFLVEIPIYILNKPLIDIVMENILADCLKLLKRWDGKKNKYVEENLDKPVITFNPYPEGWDNQFAEHRFAKKQITLASSDVNE